MSQTRPPTSPPIPSPPRLPFFGSILAMDRVSLVRGLVRLSAEYGPIVRLVVIGESQLLLGTHALVSDACDTRRFVKALHRPLRELRALSKDGLFTALNDEPNWGKAHRVLMPAFGPKAMRGYFADMLDIAEQLFTKWERLGPNATFDLTENMTRLTLDTIALCGMGYRFNSFYSDGLHPFVHAMVGTLVEATRRGGRLAVQTALAVRTRRKFDADRKIMADVVGELIARYRAEGPPEGARHLLGLMLEQPDPQTGTLLDETNIQRQLITFLVAGHETTSGMLSFATYLLLEHPEIMARATAVVDAVFDAGPPRFEHLARLGYIEQILKEALRLHPTAPAFAVTNPEPEVLAGTYPLERGDKLIVLLDRLHRDPAVWPDPDRFDPDRFSPERRDQIPAHAWLPFGNGVRACIGRVFTLQEATLVLAMMLHRFEMSYAVPYTLQIKETLTVKPANLRVRARRRQPAAARPAPPRPQPGAAPVARPRALNAAAAVAAGGPRHGTALTLAFGSNAGTCEGLARRVAGDGAARGYRCDVQPLDRVVTTLAAAGPAIIMTSSYNGEPPDNARAFWAWARALAPGSLAGRQVAVFGCGDRAWSATYQNVPRSICDALCAAGAELVLPRGEGDASGDLFGDFERWYAGLWPALAARLGLDADVTAGSLYAIEEAPAGTRAVASAPAAVLATVTENRELVDTSWPLARSKRHLALALPGEMAYRPGDYLAVRPRNPDAQVARAAALFGLATDEVVVLRSRRGNMAASLPVDVPVEVGELLATAVELASPLTAPELSRLAGHCGRPEQAEHLRFLAGDPAAFAGELGEVRASVLDLLEAYPAVALSFAEFLEFLPPMRARQYSISSSPLRTPGTATLTVAVVEGPAPSGVGRFRGSASTYLAGLPVGARVPVAVRQPNAPFHPPARNARPLLMIGAGSGLAPLRAFVEDRVLRAVAGEAAGPMWLYFGCDHPQIDFLYRDELEPLAAAGQLTLRPTFSRQPVDGCRYVQDRLWRERDEVAPLLALAPLILVCGNAKTLAAAVVATLERIHADATGADAAAATAWRQGLEASADLVLDVFG